MLKRYVHSCCIFAAVLVLSSCTGATWWNDQNKAGSESIVIDYFEASHTIKKVEYNHWKETESSTALVWLADGTRIELEAKGTKAFEGQALRAQVEKAIAKEVGTVAPGVIDNIMKALVPGGGLIK